MSFLSFDARSISMGGAGVATARPHNASLFNPALLNNRYPNRPARLHAHSYAGARFIDRNNFVGAALDFTERYQDTDLEAVLDDAIALASNEAATAADVREAVRRIRNLQADINTLSDKPLHMSASYGFSFSYPFSDWTLGGYRREFASVGSVARVADEDNAAVSYYLNAMESFANLMEKIAEEADGIGPLEQLTLPKAIEAARRLAPAVVALNDYVDFDKLQTDIQENTYRNKSLQDYLRRALPQDFRSTIASRGAEVTEQGISLARSFALASLPGQIHLGVTVKQIDVTTIAFTEPVNAFSVDGFSNEAHRRKYRHSANLDLGLLYDLNHQWQLGLVVRNLIARDFATVTGTTMELRPAARAGLGYRAGQWRLSVDVDLTRNEPLSFDPDRQYLSMGIEWFLWRNTALRAGLRSNMVNGETLPSLGFGVGGHYGHLDLAVARSFNGDEWAAGLQAGLAF
jgi:hypothetical protein